MRIKLSYTVNEDEVLPEAAKIIGLLTEEVRHTAPLFEEIQTELRGENDDKTIVNISKALSMMSQLRANLATLDIRLAEVMAIVGAYDKYTKTDNVEAKMVEENEEEAQYYGAD